ncbi:MAG: bifunctional adenosylcobinamide kinase/adenosylcobinamide-phosphate guanylyltransferase [Steroidobacteraceae bacterium]
MRELIVGGARSGKSSLALQRALMSDKEVVYVATAHAGDAEMQARIEQHRSERPVQWQTVECQQRLADCLLSLDGSRRCIIVDCLTLWLSNVLFSEIAAQLQEQAWQQQRDALLHCLPRLQGDIVLVSNEVGLGIVPDNALARHFRDEQGWLNQVVARCCERVTLVAAGLPLTLKCPT